MFIHDLKQSSKKSGMEMIRDNMCIECQVALRHAVDLITYNVTELTATTVNLSQ